jgi:hypothetical protein
MSGGQDKFTTREIIDLLDQNYGIPFDGKVQTFRLNTLSQILMLNKLISIVNWLK